MNENYIRDVPKAITAEDIIRRYNLEQLKKDSKTVAILKDSITKIDKLTENFAKTMFQYAESQADGYITAWFFSGIPTLENEPYIFYDHDGLSEKINDLYYDRDNGNVYKFALEGDSYSWKSCDDNNLKQVMAVANSDSDVADNRRNFYITTPSPPYDVGDVWYDYGVIKRCRCSRESEEFHSTDWCLQSDYSDSFVILETKAILNQLEKVITKDIVTSAQLEATKDSILGTVASETIKLTHQFNDYATIENVEVVNQKVENLQTSTSETIKIIEDFQVNGVSKVKTEKGFTFDNEGLTIDESNSPTKFNADTNGIEVFDKTGNKNETLLFAGFDETLGESVVKSKNFVVEKYLNIGKYSRIEDYEPDGENPGTGIFFVG